MRPTIDNCRIGILNTEALLAIRVPDTEYYYANETYSRLVKQLNGFIHMLAKLQERQYITLSR